MLSRFGLVWYAFGLWWLDLRADVFFIVFFIKSSPDKRLLWLLSGFAAFRTVFMFSKNQFYFIFIFIFILEIFTNNYSFKHILTHFHIKNCLILLEAHSGLTISSWVMGIG